MSTPDKVYKFYTEDLALRASVIRSTAIVRETCAIHETFPLASMALGRLLTGTILMASQLGEKQSICVRIDGKGALGQLYADANFEGEVRGYCQNPLADIPHTSEGKLDVGTGVGQGIMTVTRNVPFQRAPHVGIVPITSGEISPDLAFYLQQSHQIPSVVALTVTLDGQGEVKVAGGVLIEIIAGAPDSTIRILEERAQTAPLLSQQLLSGASEEEILRPYLHSPKIKVVEHTFPIVYTCHCSTERVERTLSLMGRATIAEMALKGETVQVKCEFCGKKYSVTLETLRRLLSEFPTSTVH